MLTLASIAWWSSVAVLVVAAGFDLRTRRIPNWLTLPFLLSGVVMQSIMTGTPGLGRSLAGAGLACALFLIPCFLRVMGMGDLKLIAGVGAWVGPAQLMLALVFISIAGGVMAIFAHYYRGGRGRLPGDASELSIPYAPAIAVGSLFSFFAV